MIIIDNSRLMLQIVESLTNYSRGVIYSHNIFIVQATGQGTAGVSTKIFFKANELQGKMVKTTDEKGLKD
jgi:hypothetical protein